LAVGPDPLEAALRQGGRVGVEGELAAVALYHVRIVVGADLKQHRELLLDDTLGKALLEDRVAAELVTAREVVADVEEVHVLQRA
jgi:hypothetical protein